jgi:hypothetical protein
MMLARRAAIQQVVAGAIMHGCAATMVVCSTKFSAAAQRLANAHGCVWWTGPGWRSSCSTPASSPVSESALRVTDVTAS